MLRFLPAFAGAAVCHPRTGPGESVARADTVHVLKNLCPAWESDRSDNHTVGHKDSDDHRAGGDWGNYSGGAQGAFRVWSILILGTWEEWLFAVACSRAMFMRNKVISGEITPSHTPRYDAALQTCLSKWGRMWELENKSLYPGMSL